MENSDHLDGVSLVCSDLKLSGLRIFPQRKSLFVVQLHHLLDLGLAVAGEPGKFEDGVNVNKAGAPVKQ